MGLGCIVWGSGSIDYGLRPRVEELGSIVEFRVHSFGLGFLGSGSRVYSFGFGALAV